MYAGSSPLAVPLRNVIVILDDPFVSAVGTPTNGAQLVAPPEPPAFEPVGVTETQRPTLPEG
jgi:hypothetical protein